MFSLGLVMLDIATLHKYKETHDWTMGKLYTTIFSFHLIFLGRVCEEAIEDGLKALGKLYSPALCDTLHKMLELEEAFRPDFIKLSKTIMKIMPKEDNVHIQRREEVRRTRL